MGGEVKLDWSQATIPIGNKKVTITLENKDKYIVLASKDPKSHILYNEIDFSNYFVSPGEEIVGSREVSKEGLWTLELDGNCALVGLGVRFFLIKPSSKSVLKAFELDFENTNNTMEYGALLLGIKEAKRRGV